MSKVSLSDAKNRANELYSAANYLKQASTFIDDAIEKLNKGATTNKIKTQITSLNKLKNEISGQMSTINSAANQIISIAQNLQDDN